MFNTGFNDEIMPLISLFVSVDSLWAFIYWGPVTITTTAKKIAPMVIIFDSNFN